MSKLKLLLAAALGSIATASWMKRKQAGRDSMGATGAGGRMPAAHELPEPAREMHLPQQGALVMTPPDRNGNNVYYGS
ncbi:hypothetical protein [Caldimonas tepidiphila]|uniref:hypothetical protein n=1 Tax=Caldimonas tepidiphila TaxID=2315841 RepID=UPI000E5BE9E7|nr:hypothetical protein [Caldimonas tepidiphila]